MTTYLLSQQGKLENWVTDLLSVALNCQTKTSLLNTPLQLILWQDIMSNPWLEPLVSTLGCAPFDPTLGNCRQKMNNYPNVHFGASVICCSVAFDYQYRLGDFCCSVVCFNCWCCYFCSVPWGVVFVFVVFVTVVGIVILCLLLYSSVKNRGSTLGFAIVVITPLKRLFVS